MLESLSQDAAYDSGGKLFGQKVNRLWFDQIILDHWETFPAFLSPGFLPPISGFFLVADHSAGERSRWRRLGQNKQVQSWGAGPGCTMFADKHCAGTLLW